MTLEEVKGYAFLNIFGLATGMACCILIGLWVLDELNYDRFHENASSICRVESDQEFNGRTLHIYWTPHPLGPALKTEIPEIEDSTRAASLNAQLIRYKNKAFEEYSVWSVDPSFQPVNTLKGKMKSVTGNTVFRRTLVVIQFVLSAALIIGTGVVSKQMTFIKNRNLGWNKEQVVAIPIRSYSRPSLETFKAELANTPGILNVAVASQKPSFTSWSSSGFDWEGKDPSLKVDVTNMGADDGYVDTMGMTLTQGRNFSKEFPTDKTESFLINEALADLNNNQTPPILMLSTENVGHPVD